MSDCDPCKQILCDEVDDFLVYNLQNPDAENPTSDPTRTTECPACIGISCPVEFEDLQIYNLQTNIIFNTEPITVTVPCPAGWQCVSTLTVTYPPGTFVIPDDGSFGAQGCLSFIAASSAGELFSLLAAQQAYCDAVSNPPGDWTPPSESPPSGGGVVSITLGALSGDAVCEDADYSGTIEATTVVGGPVTFEVLSGSLPTGTTLTSEGKTATISGTATATGYYEFVIKATALGGASTVRLYGITVLGIPQDSLPDATSGYAYSSTLGPADGTWSITDGSLPSGLTLDADTGIISGTTTLIGDYPFTVGIQSGDTVCTKDLSIHVASIFSAMVWSEVSRIETGFGVASWSADENTFASSIFAPAPGGTSSDALIVYQGIMAWPGAASLVNGKVVISIVADAGAGLLQSGSNYVQVYHNASLRLNFSTPQSRTTGDYELPFTIPVTSGTLKIIIGMRGVVGSVNVGASLTEQYGGYIAADV